MAGAATGMISDDEARAVHDKVGPGIHCSPNHSRGQGQTLVPPHSRRNVSLLTTSK
jgi:hypothetical protein